MTDDLNFELLMQLTQDTNNRVRKIEEDVKDVKLRMTLVERGQAGIHSRIDSVENRLDTIETRLGLNETKQ